MTAKVVPWVVESSGAELEHWHESSMDVNTLTSTGTLVTIAGRGGEEDGTYIS